jgi:hypothetical protein
VVVEVGLEEVEGGAWLRIAHVPEELLRLNVPYELTQSVPNLTGSTSRIKLHMLTCDVGSLDPTFSQPRAELRHRPDVLTSRTAAVLLGVKPLGIRIQI